MYDLIIRANSGLVEFFGNTGKGEDFLSKHWAIGHGEKTNYKVAAAWAKQAEAEGLKTVLIF